MSVMSKVWRGYLQCKHLPPLAAASDVLLKLVLLFITILAFGEDELVSDQS